MFSGIDEIDDLDQLRSRYEVLATLGVDGDLLVHSVRCRTSGRHFAVKLMPATARGRGQKPVLSPWQAHTVQPLDHPGLMVLRAVHHLQGGTVAIAVERRRGETLAERLTRDGALSAEAAGKVLREVADALQYLHGRGIVHGGIRPSSIFLDRDSGSAKLGYFGVDRGSDSAAMSRSRGMQSTFQAPEQGGGTPRAHVEVTQAADLYALGCAGVAMLTHTANGSDAHSGGEVARCDPRSALAAIEAEIPANLRNALRGCIVADPRRRLRGVVDFLAQLDPNAPTSGANSSASGMMRPDVGKWVSAGRSALASVPAFPRARRRALAGLGACLALFSFLRLGAALGEAPAERVAIAEVVAGSEDGEGVRQRQGTLDGVRLPAIVVSSNQKQPSTGGRSSAASSSRSPIARPTPRNLRPRGPRLLGVPVRQERVVLLGDAVSR